MTAGREHTLASVLSIVSYGLAAVTLAAGLILTVGIVSAAGGVPDAIAGLRGLGSLLSPLIEPLHTAVELAAVVVFMLGVMASGLLLALGGLLASVHRLGRRLARLEDSRRSNPSAQGARPSGTDL